MTVLGISGLYHDAAAAVVENGRIVAAAQEERFSRTRHDPRWPDSAIAFCRRQVASPLDYVAFYEDPVATLDRVVSSAIHAHPAGAPQWRHAAVTQFGDKAAISARMATLVPDARRRLFVRHHLSHAASAFFPSPFARAAVVVADGVGEWATTSIFLGEDQSLRLLKQIDYPHSLGLLYSAFTAFCGFKVNSGEYKLMGLAPFGRPRFAQRILDHLLRLHDDGSYVLNMSYFEFDRSDRMAGEPFAALFGTGPREPNSPLLRIHADLAASVQQVLSEAMQRVARAAVALCDARDLCLAGGVALNCLVNRDLRRARIADRVWVQPAAGDAGGALGAALYVSHALIGATRLVDGDAGDAQQGSFLGPSFEERAVERSLDRAGLLYHRISNRDEHHGRVAESLLNGKIVGRFHGRMEFGPRALGARSIIADPRRPSARSRLNLQIKFRESWRPFAPAVLAEHAADWFDVDAPSPYMLFTAVAAAGRRCVSEEEDDHGDDFARSLEARTSGSDVPAVIHVDGGSRVQTVDGTRNPDFHALLMAFYRRTGCPMLVNTSFNVRGEPIVCTPDDAVRCFLNSGIDMLAIGDFLVWKDEQSAAARQRERGIRFEPD